MHYESLGIFPSSMSSRRKIENLCLKKRNSSHSTFIFLYPSTLQKKKSPGMNILSFVCWDFKISDRERKSSHSMTAGLESGGPGLEPGTCMFPQELVPTMHFLFMLYFFFQKEKIFKLQGFKLN